MDDTIAAPAEAVANHALDGTAALGDISMWSLFINAGSIVQVVIICLMAASVMSWVIIFEKYSKFKSVRYKSDRFEANFWSGTPLDQLFEKYQKAKNLHPLSSIFVNAMEEINRTGITNNPAAKLGLKERVARIMQVAKNRALDDLEDRLGFLATVGSTAPFVGLFGTVWGIMHSFTSIAAQKNISLATVAPGIAEALFATAIGLVAAIPAVSAYNKFSGQLDKITQRTEDFADELHSLISRQLDEGSL
jgi:biopolymer transport protein TolQ